MCVFVCSPAWRNPCRVPGGCWCNNLCWWTLCSGEAGWSGPWSWTAAGAHCPQTSVNGSWQSCHNTTGSTHGLKKRQTVISRMKNVFGTSLLYIYRFFTEVQICCAQTFMYFWYENAVSIHLLTAHFVWRRGRRWAASSGHHQCEQTSSWIRLLPS